MPLRDFDHFSLFKHTQVPIQVAVGKRTELLQITEGQTPRVADQ
jgi:hypothetical protein